jgi:hypothetical protein
MTNLHLTCPICGRTSYNPNDLAERYCGACHLCLDDVVVIAPGVYDDGHGGMHINVRALLRANGYADTPANRETLARAAQDLIRDQFPQTKTIVTE